MTAEEHTQLVALVEAHEDAAAALHVESRWRARFLEDAARLRTATLMPVYDTTSAPSSAKRTPSPRLRLASVDGQVSA